MQDIDLFLPDLLTLVPNCPDPLAFRWLRRAAMQICTRTKLWREADTFPIVPDEWEGVCTVTDAAIVEIENAMLDGQQLRPVTPADLDAELPNWQFSPEVGTARFITQVKSDTVTVIPRASGTLQARLILKPSVSAEQFPDFLLEHYSELVAKGAASNLLMQPKTDFENPALAGVLKQEFREELDSAASRAAKGQQRAPARVKARWF